MTDLTPTVSVIIPTFNRAEVLRCAIRTVLGQTFSDFEVLVVGDACTDDSAAAVAALGDPRVIWHNLAINSGSQSAPNSKAQRLARGKYVAFLSHDDLWFPWHLETALARIEETGADLVYGLEVGLDPTGVIDAHGPPSHGRDYWTSSLPPSTWLVRREVVARVGDWSDKTAVETWVDHDYLRRMIQAGATVAPGAARLSIIRFPSHDWSLYSRKSGFPQPGFLARMEADPAGLEYELLVQSLETLARARQPVLGPRAALRALHESVIFRIHRRFGIRLQMPGAFRRWAYQRRRQRARIRRGLRRDD